MFRSLKTAIAVAFLVAALAVVPSAGAVGVTAPSSWPQLGFNGARTGVNPNEKVLSASTVPGLVERWVSSRGSWMPSNPVVADGDVYWLGKWNPTTLVASKATTGARVWVRHATYRLTDPIVVGNTVYTARLAGNRLFALDARTGAVLRATPMIDNWGLVYANGVLFTWPRNGPMGAYVAATGHRLWTSDVGEVDEPPAAADGAVFAVNNLSSGHFLVALDAATGAQLWSKPVPDQVDAAPVVAGKLVFVGTIYGRLLAFNRTTGALVWEKTFGTGADLEFAPAVFKGRVYQIVFNSCRAIVSVMNAATGAAAWSRTIDDDCGRFPNGGGDGSPAIANGLVYVPALKKIWIFTTAGNLAKVLSTGGDDLVGTPVVAAGRVFVATYGTGRPHGHMRAFAIKDLSGEPRM